LKFLSILISIYINQKLEIKILLSFHAKQMRRLTLTLLLLFILHLNSVREISCAAHDDDDDLHRVPSVGIVNSLKVNASNANSTDHNSSTVAGSEKK
jgi:hypothetical protein